MMIQKGESLKNINFALTLNLLLNLSNMKTNLLGLCFVLFALCSFGQTLPPNTSYQAVARSSDGDVLSNANLIVRIAVLSETVDGAIQYEETHSLTTNDFGLFNLNIGAGTNTGSGSSASYLDVSWSSNPHFMRIEIDPGDGIFEWLGTSQIMAVPYAYHARTVEIDQINDADADPGNELITSFGLVDNTLTIEENGVNFDVDLSTFEQSDDEDWMLGSGIVFNDTDDIGIGTSDPNSSLEVNGSFARSVNFISITDDTSITVDEDDHTVVVQMSTANMEITLPPANSCPGREYIFKAFSSAATDNVTITGTGDDIDGENEWIINGAQKESVHIISAGSNGWIVIN